MKHKLTQKLIAYFTIPLVIFVLVLGLIFTNMYRKNIIKRTQVELVERADTIASSLSTYLERRQVEDVTRNNRHQNHGMNRERDFNQYLEVVDKIAMSEVWIIDATMQTVSVGHGSKAVDFESIPLDGETMIREALAGNTIQSEGFSPLLNNQSISVGVPVRNSNEEVIAAVLLHSAVSGIQETVQEGYLVLAIGMGFALMTAVVVAFFLSKKFVKPILIMDEVSQKMIEGDYQVQTHINQNDEIGGLSKTLDTLSLRLQEVETERMNFDQLRQDFFADISHELRTPITVLRGSLEAFNDGIIHDKNEQQLYFNQMLLEVAQLQKLVDDLLDLSRLNRTEFKLTYEVFALNDVMTDSVRSMNTIAKANDVTLEVHLKPEIYMFEGDYARIRQMLMIVMDNAIKFSPPNDKVSISLNKTNDTVEMVIRDRGAGIADETYEHIFNRFYTSSKDNESGIGIGLAIAKRIADLHNINIKVENDHGAVFRFFFQTAKPGLKSEFESLCSFSKR